MNDHNNGGDPQEWDTLMRRFGYDCPMCSDPEGMLGTVSCQNCGYIPEEVRA